MLLREHDSVLWHPFLVAPHGQGVAHLGRELACPSPDTLWPSPLCSLWLPAVAPAYHIKHLSLKAACQVNSCLQVM